jgi:putative MATE family efflux protein
MDSASDPGSDICSAGTGAMPRAAPDAASAESLAAEVRHSPILSGDIHRTLLTLAAPVLLEQFLIFCVGFYDTWLAGNLPGGVSTIATGAVGVGAYVDWLATTLFSLVAAGTTALVARSRGAGKFVEANRIANRSIGLAVLAGLAFVAFVVPAAPFLARTIVGDNPGAAVAARFLRIDAIGLEFTSVSLAGAAALRGAGNMRTPMWILGAVSVLNVIVATALVYGVGPIPPLGIDGIVLGTTMARCAGGLLMLAVLIVGVSDLKLSTVEIRFRDALVRRILAIGIPAAIDGGVMWTGHFIFLHIIGGFGDAAFAAHVVGVRVEAVTYLPAVAWGVAAATIVGQSLGAGDPERARLAGHAAVRQCALLGVVITAVFLGGARAIYARLHNDPVVAELGVPAFRMLALFQVPNIVAIIYLTGLRGAGDTRAPLVITIVTTIGLRLSLAWLCGVALGGGLFGAWVGMCADMLTRGVLAAVRFAGGRWSRVRV